MHALIALVLAALAPVVPQLPTGPPPQVAYGYAAHPTFGGGDWELIRTDGSRQPLPSPPVQLVVADDRVVNGYATEGGFVVEVVDRSGAVVLRRDGLCGFGLATDASRSRAAWLDGRSVAVLDDRSQRPQRHRVGLPPGPQECGRNNPVSLAGRHLFLSGDRRVDPFFLRPGRSAVSVESLARVSDADGRLVVGRRPDSPCSAVTTLNGVRRWQTCDHRLLDLAPDRRHVLAITGPSRYGRAKAVSFFDRDGRLVGEWARPAGALIDDVRWEDSAHALAVVQDAQGWSVVRIGTDGTAEYAVPPVAVPPDYAPFRLALS